MSELTRRPVRGDVAMTGEITLSGRCCRSAASRKRCSPPSALGIKEIILPRQNAKNVNEDLNDELRKGLTIHLVNTIDEVLLLALLPAAEGARKEGRQAVAAGDAVAQVRRVRWVR